jgi:hypothetical protein
MQLTNFEDVARVTEAVMGDFGRPWGVAGGWALDLFLGRVTRVHGDLEVAIFREDQGRLLEHLRRWRFEKVVEGRRYVWESGEWIGWPTHEIHGRLEGKAEGSIEVLLNERVGDEWVFRRNDLVRMPVKEAMLRTGIGVPILSPAIVLLYKAKMPREKDEADFCAVRDWLDGETREWFKVALEICHPGHQWLSMLERFG